mgnify:CR=1 FL=1
MLTKRQEDFRTFSETVRRTICALGIHGSWDITIVDKPKCKDKANCAADWKCQQAMFTFGNPDKETDLSRLAKHEVGHLLSCGFRDLVLRPFVSEDEFEHIDEWFANVMEKILPSE